MEEADKDMLESGEEESLDEDKTVKEERDVECRGHMQSDEKARDSEHADGIDGGNDVTPGEDTKKEKIKGAPKAEKTGIKRRNQRGLRRQQW